jgi:hypothetical protein
VNTSILFITLNGIMTEETTITSFKTHQIYDVTFIFSNSFTFCDLRDVSC